MKNILLSTLVIFCLIIFNCESEPITGSEEVDEISFVTFSIDTTYAFGDDFRAEGKVTNSGNEAITPIWYVEGSFFRDGQQTIKMGGANDWFNFSLAPGQSAEWFLKFKDSQYPTSENPNFSVGELRAYKDQTSSDD